VNSQTFTAQVTLIGKFLALGFTTDTIDSELNGAGRVLVLTRKVRQIELLSALSRETEYGHE